MAVACLPTPDAMASNTQVVDTFAPNRLVGPGRGQVSGPPIFAGLRTLRMFPRGELAYHGPGARRRTGPAASSARGESHLGA